MPESGRGALTAPATTMEPDWPALLSRVIAGEGLRSVFQPIVDLQRCTVVGFEALTRFDIGPPVGPDVWFDQAAALDVLPALESAALMSALARRSSLPGNTFMTVNVEPDSLLEPTVMRVLRAQGDLRGLVVEITEHRPLGDSERLASMLHELRSAGALIAVDDAGAGYAGLQQILFLRPSILKLDRALIEGIDTDEAKAALVEMIGHFANRIDAWLLAEGIETAAEARRCSALGVPLVQGYYFARPASSWATIDPDAAMQLSDMLDGELRASLRHLMTLTPSVEAAPDGTGHLGEARSRFSDDATDHVVVVDRDERPLGLFTVDSMMRGELLTTMTANVHTSPAELAHRLSTTIPDDVVPPTIVTDNAGRYIGTVNIRRLLAAVGTNESAHAVSAPREPSAAATLP